MNLCVRHAGATLLFAGTSSFLALVVRTTEVEGKEFRAGGYLGQFLGGILSDYLNMTGSIILILTVLFLAVILSTQFSFGRLFGAIGEMLRDRWAVALGSLREWREETDFEAYARICADPEVMRYMGGRPFSRLESWRHMAYIVGHWQMRGFGHWAVEEKATGGFVGRLGFQDPEGWPEFEIGWTIDPRCQGRGYATEGARRALEYGFSELDRAHVISLIHPENRASIAVARRLGETLEGETAVMGIDVHVYGLSRDRWRSAAYTPRQ